METLKLARISRLLDDARSELQLPSIDVVRVIALVAEAQSNLLGEPPTVAEQN